MTLSEEFEDEENAKMKLRGIVAGCLLLALLGWANSASALSIIVTLSEFSGTPQDAGESYPLDPVTIGTFVYDIPQGHTVESGSLTGKFGNSQGGNTAPMKLLFDDLLITECSPGGSCTTVPEESISFNFAKFQFAYFEQNPNTLRAVQTGPGTIRLDSWTLAIKTKPIPEASTLLLFGLGLIGLIHHRTRPEK